MSPHTTSSPQLLTAASPERRHWIELPAHRSHVAVARRLMDARMSAWRLPAETSADAVLLVSELVTNAVCHTLSVRILCGIGLIADDCLRVEVHDHGRAAGGLPRCEPGPEDEGGRGLLLVQEIAHTWGVDRSPLTGGNAVWATLMVSDRERGTCVDEEMPGAAAPRRAS
ncbi:ATP-binding protein [Streptomyces sp. NBC_01352]|uniref:ATP-binding protein n=1 Tax=Streptomyces sp. NBC_01352 TaxID=2903834 RepID=UPI003FCCBD74